MHKLLTETKIHALRILTLGALTACTGLLFATGPAAAAELSGVESLSVGNSHSCAVLTNHTIKCWGRNNYGQLGTGTNKDSAVPVTVEGVGNALSVSAGTDSTCALLTSHTISCWGRGDSGQLGNGTFSTSSTSPVQVTGITNAKMVAAGGNYACALLTTNTIKCWGAGGRLGNGLNAHSSTPVDVNGIANAETISAGNTSSCALLQDKTVTCWGENNYGQLGNGTENPSLIPALVANLTGVESISVGLDNYACALLTNKDVYCWGINNYDAFGNGVYGSEHHTPVKIQVTDPNTKSFSAGYTGSCVTLTDNTIKCWGYNYYGQLGNNEKAVSSDTPTSVHGISTAVSVEQGVNFACALLANKTVRCWGRAFFSQLGNGSSPSAFTPVTVTGITGAASVDVGDEHACASLTDGTARCWGSAWLLGIDPENPAYDLEADKQDAPAPVEAVGLAEDALGIDVGDEHSCAVLNNGTVSCWGNEDDNRLGSLYPQDPPSPMLEVPGVTTAASVSAGYSHSCVVLNDGKIKCWGSNGSGELGDHDEDGFVDDIANSSQVSTGWDFSCALDAATAKCWGSGYYGTLGVGNNDDYDTPQSVNEITDAVSISAGYMHACAALTSGAVKCWGNNYAGQLGNNSKVDSSIPVAVEGIVNAQSVSAGNGYSCAVLSTKRVMCWGSGESGELGSGAGVDSLVPVEVAGITNATSVSAGVSTTCALLDTTEIKCWGWGEYGQLGDGTAAVGGHYPISRVPVAVLSGYGPVTPIEPEPDPGTPEPDAGTPKPNPDTPKPDPDVVKPVKTIVAVPSVSKVVVPASSLRLSAVKRSGQVQVRVPVPTAQTSVRVQIVITAKQARALKLRVPKRAKTVTIGTATTRSARRNQTRMVTIRLTAPARRALTRARTTRTLRLSIKLRFTHNAYTPKTITKTVTLRR